MGNWGKRDKKERKGYGILLHREIFIEMNVHREPSVIKDEKSEEISLLRKNNNTRATAALSVLVFPSPASFFPTDYTAHSRAPKCAHAKRSEGASQLAHSCSTLALARLQLSPRPVTPPLFHYIPSPQSIAFQFSS